MSHSPHAQFLDPDRQDAHPAVAVRTHGELAMELALARRRFEATFLHAPVGIAHVGLDGRFLLVNPRFCEISGHDAETLIRTGFQKITHPDDLHADEILLARLNAGEFPRYSMEKRYIRATGETVWINLTVSMMRDEEGRPELYVAVIEDLSEIRRASFDALHDPLTGILNRRGLMCRAEPLLAQAWATERNVSLLFVDLDGFKALNDEHGHGAGDACLVRVARCLRDQARAQDVVARVGGDEFVVLMARLEADAAHSLSRQLCRAIARLQDGVSGSFGLVTVHAADRPDLDDLILQADTAMLAAKRAGKNRLHVAGPI